MASCEVSEKILIDQYLFFVYLIRCGKRGVVVSPSDFGISSATGIVDHWYASYEIRYVRKESEKR